MKKIGIIGYGWLGERIASSLSGKYTISATTTTENKAEDLNNKGMNAVVASFPDYQLTEPVPQWEEVKNIDILIITIPVSEKSCCVSSLYNRIQNLSAFIGDFTGQMFLMSSTGVYPDLPKEFTEEDVPFENVSGERMLRNKYPQLSILRLGGLMGDNRLLKNYNVGNLDHAVNHIHYADISAIITQMIENKVEAKLYNVTAPVHPAKSQVINVQKNILDEEVFEIKGKKVLSSKLISELDYVFQYSDPRTFHL
ncbi:NAD-binding protein [Chryseobacterium sp. JV274]|uniref:NAD-binding protein n=1 Tax=Chryseobacterium sp. JV274 TaxID=1932669 RepID=UPI0015C1DF17|nr:NAD-binding protein [Chryseobacterium sp. JV274]CAD0218028.1 RCK N-terminal domain-containing protein [Chryseobacterium sp. JV274]